MLSQSYCRAALVLAIGCCGSLAHAAEVMCKLSNDQNAKIQKTFVTVLAVARDSSNGEEKRVSTNDIRVKYPANPTEIAVTNPDPNTDEFQVATDDDGQFILVFANSAFEQTDAQNVVIKKYNELDLTISGFDQNRRIAVSVNNLSTDDAQNFSLVLNNVALTSFQVAGDLSLAPDGLVQDFRAGTASFLLAGDTGTISYQSLQPAPMRLDEMGRVISAGPGYKIQSVRKSGGSENFVFYDEEDSVERTWAFAKQPTNVCRCVNGRWVLAQSGYRIYYRNRFGSGKWIFFGFAEVKNPTRNLSADAEPVR